MPCQECRSPLNDGLTIVSQPRCIQTFTLHRRADAHQIDVYLSIPREELLYSRANASAPFVAQIEVALADTTWLLNDTAWADASPILRARWTLDDVPTNPGLEVTLSDVLRNASVSARKWLGPSGTWAPSDLLIWSQKQQWPLPGEEAQVGDTLLIGLPNVGIAPTLGTLTWDVQNYTPPQSLPLLHSATVGHDGTPCSLDCWGPSKRTV